MKTWLRCGENCPDARNEDDGAKLAIRREGVTQQMGSFRRNPKGWAYLLRCAALLVVAISLAASYAFLLALDKLVKGERLAQLASNPSAVTFSLC